ncbi:MAG: hypothetical protein KME26_20470 [Oscillatoria princeps RMCB-10]|nr:hypothetical protein [Oscillatoria princeps RMCB-10]
MSAMLCGQEFGGDCRHMEERGDKPVGYCQFTHRLPAPYSALFLGQMTGSPSGKILPVCWDKNFGKM